MTRFDRIITESIDRVLNENNFKNGINKVKAAANGVYNKKGGDLPKDRINDWLAKQAALKDINAELASMRSKPRDGKIYRGGAFSTDDEWERNYFNDMADRREEDFDDYYNSDNDFYRPIHNF